MLSRPVCVPLRDGLYAVVRRDWVAGFVVQNGLVTMCAPILRGRVPYYSLGARWVCP